MTHRTGYIIHYSPLITVIDRTVFRYINAIVGYYVRAHTKIIIISLRTKSFCGFRYVNRIRETIHL